MGDPSRVRITGPLEAYASGFAAELRRVGYRENPTADQLRLMAHLSRWLEEQGLGGEQLTPSVQAAFLAARRATGYTLWLSPKALVPMLEYLRRHGVTPPEPVVVLRPTEAVLERSGALLEVPRTGYTARSNSASHPSPVRQAAPGRTGQPASAGFWMS